MAIRVALASDDGITVDQHFGHARYFSIYDIEGESFAEVEQRSIPYEYLAFGCGDCGGCPPAGEVSAEQKFGGALKVLGDCEALFVSRIGQGAAYLLLEHKIRVFQVFGPIGEILNYVIAKKLLAKEEPE